MSVGGLEAGSKGVQVVVGTEQVVCVGDADGGLVGRGNGRGEDTDGRKTETE